MIERERLKAEAQAEYEKEKANVEAVIQQMINEDMAMMHLTKAKQEQSKRDMIASLMIKKANLDRLREIDRYENEMVRKYAELQDKRESDIKEQKAIAEAEREKIFEKLREEEEQRRLEQEYIENLRNQLQQEEFEESL
jgi:hypothetical protein